MLAFLHLPHSVLQAGAIFLSILIEALPFVLLGAILSGFLEVYVRPDHIHRFLPSHPFLRVVVGSLIGFFFPSCECGLVPIVHRLLEKKVPASTAFPFLITAPILNPLVLFATYTAFGNSLLIPLYRVAGSLCIALVIGSCLLFVSEDSLVKEVQQPPTCCQLPSQGWKKLGTALLHAIDEFFATGRYLIAGSLFASLVQVYLPTVLLTRLTQQPVAAIGMMMLLAFLLSLCSEADAFIGASLLPSFGLAPVLAFLILGPIVDVKNLLMMTSYFRGRAILAFVVLTSSLTLFYCLLIGGLR